MIVINLMVSKIWEDASDLIEGVDRKAVAVGVGAAAGLAVSYLVFRRVTQSKPVSPVRADHNLVKEQENVDDFIFKRQQEIQALQNAAAGTKTIYFDTNDTMYTEEEVKGRRIAGLTKMVVRVPEAERKRYQEVRGKQTQQRLVDFLGQIQSSKSEFYYKGRRHHDQTKNLLRRDKAKSVRHGSQFSTSSGNSNNPRLEPRHFKNKEGAVWLNMFETISQNYCMSKPPRHERVGRLTPPRQNSVSNREFQMDMSLIPEERE